MANDDLEALFARREEIDRSLQQHQRELSVMFTDIVGSTQYFEQKGDIAGMALLRRHNGLLFPVVQECSGRIIKTIGDAIMAVFDRPQDAVRCAQRMQRALETEKRSVNQERIHIRIGAHHGRAFVTEKDVFGDTVNTAARVAHEAGGDEIVVSQHLAEALAASGGFRMQPRGQVALKGKAEPLPLFLVSWRDEVGAAPGQQLAARRELPEMFSLELQRGPAGLKVAALDGDADKGTVKLYAESPLSPAQLQEISNRFSAFIGGGAAGSYLARIQEQGRTLFDAALSDRARQKLKGSRLSYLRLELDDELVGVPWELMHDGQDFLCLRFAVGRMVAARDDASSSGGGGARAAVAGHAVVVSNPSGDLPAATAEGEAVAGLLKDGFDGEVRHLRGPVTRQAFAAAVKGCSLLHFAGHSEGAGFVLADGHCAPHELVKAVGASAPVLVFANGCSASEGAGFTSAARGVTDVASALLRQGTQHYVGPMCAMGDSDALSFALRFYEAALGGAALGEAATEARRSLVQRATHPVAFAGYLLYGDPRRPFPGRVRLQRPQTRGPGPGPHTPTTPAPEVATPLPNYNTPQPWSGPEPEQNPLSPPTRAQRHRPPSVPRGQALEPPSPAPAPPYEPPSAGSQSAFDASAFAPTVPSPGALQAPAVAGPPVVSHTVAVEGSPLRIPTAPSQKKRPPIGLIVGAFAIVVGGGSGAWFATHRISVDPVTPGTGAGAGAGTSGTATPTPPRPRTGEVRLTVLPFKNVSADKELDPLKEGLAEAVVTDFQSRAGFKVIEHGLVGEEIQYIEFTQTKYVDPATKAQLGKIKGAEVVVLGSYQRSGLVLRANARFVDSETGEILQSIKVEAPEIFMLQDKLGAEAKRLAPDVRAQLRPQGGGK
ncbi:MAG TPA: adenylate/guanylate cyclase domain-containing protein [Myxococcaceae bacterium]